MSLRENRHITFYQGGEPTLVPAHSQIENTRTALKVKFVFEPNTAATELEYVIADNEQGYIRMVTSKGNQFNAGSLFDQLYVWFDYIVKG